MVILNLYIDNVYLYDKFSMNFTYDRKLSNNPVEFEYLQNYENFKYRKVNVLFGANSSGKTSLGKVIMDIQNFISKQNEIHLPKHKIRDKRKPAYCQIDFYENDMLYRYSVKFNKDQVLEDKLLKTDLKKTDSYNTAINKLKTSFEKYYDVGETYDPSNLKKEDFGFGWYYSFARLTDDSSPNTKFDVKYLETILKGFDCTVKAVKKISGTTNSFNIEFINKESIIVDNGKISESSKERISSGTYESIRIASILEEIRGQERNYFIDENLVYTHTELEKEVLNFMIYSLKADSQLFFTTHNLDVLEMYLPVHAFQFLKNNKGRFEVIDICKTFSKIDRKLRNYVEADFFNTMPDTSFIEVLIDG